MSKTIDLEDVRSALMLSVHRAWAKRLGYTDDGKPLARWAAYTCHVQGSVSYRKAATRALPRLALMHRGGLADLIRMVLMQHGSAEVRSTWGVGMQALRRECQGALR